MSQQTIDNFITYRTRTEDTEQNLEEEFTNQWSSFSFDIFEATVPSILIFLGEKVFQQAEHAREIRLRNYATILITDWIRSPEFTDSDVLDILSLDENKPRREFNIVTECVIKLLDEDLNLRKKFENTYRSIFRKFALSETPNKDEIYENVARRTSLGYNQLYSEPKMEFGKDFFIKNIVLLEKWGILQQAKSALCIRYEILMKLNPRFEKIDGLVEKERATRIVASKIDELKKRLDFAITQKGINSRNEEEGENK